MPLTRPLTMPLSRPLGAPAVVGPAASGAYDYAALFSGLSATGWCFHGGADRSAFFEDSAGTTPAIDDGVSPVGRITTLSGTGAHGVQATTGAKPTFHTAGGVRWWEYGIVNSANRHMGHAVDCFASAAMTQIVLAQRGGTASGNYVALISNLVGGSWGSGGYHRLAMRDGVDLDDFLCDGTTSPLSVAGAGVFAPVIIVANRAGTGTNEATLTTYDLAGVQKATVTGTQNAVPANKLLMGYDGVAGSQVFCGFNMMINASLSGTDVDAIVADLVAAFAGWSP